MTLIECKNLTIGYDSKIVLSDLNFSIENGSNLYILGENGSGNCTFRLLKQKWIKTLLFCKAKEKSKAHYGNIKY